MLKLTEELIAGMSEKIADGIPVCYTCDFFNIHETTYEAWMKQGEQDFLDEQETLYSALYRAIKKSYAQHIINATARIKSGVQGWQGTAWLLERTNPKYMPKQQIQADDDGKVTVVIGGKEKTPKPASKK